MGKLRRTVLITTIPVILILILEGIIYYSGSGLTAYGVLLCTLENAVMSFVARPTLYAFHALRAVNNGYTPFERLITNAYGAVLIIAPILTTTAVLSGFQSYVRDFLFSLKMTVKGKMYVIGDGKMSGIIARKYAEKYFVHYLMPVKTENKDRLPYLKNKVMAFTADYFNLKPVLKECSIEKAACVVLDFKSWFDNLQAVNDIFLHLMQNSDDEPTPVCIIDAPALYRDVFVDMYHGLCSKCSRKETVLTVQFVNTNEINVRKFFENPELTLQPDNRHHIAVLGTGSYGITLLNELIHYMNDNGLRGTIEIFDRNMEHIVTDLMYSSDSLRYRDLLEITEAEENASLSAAIKTEAGPIKTNYYMADTGELRFTRYLDTILKKDPLTEIFFCIDDIASNLECFRMVSSCLTGHENVKVYFRAGKKAGISSDIIRLGSNKIYLLPDGLPDIELFR